jgi:hypothetical protein
MALSPIANHSPPDEWPQRLRAALEYWSEPISLTTFGSARGILNEIAQALELPLLANKDSAAVQRAKINAIIEALNDIPTLDLSNPSATQYFGAL